jgi:hypothetical protein
MNIPQRVNALKHRGDPKSAILESGHTVTKEEYLYFTAPSDGTNPETKQAVPCMDYHDAHFLYVNPLYELNGPAGYGQVPFMCTCGAMANVISAGEAFRLGLPPPPNNAKKMVVCEFHTNEVVLYGVLQARHQTSYVNKR